MSSLRSESHVAQQIRRDKLRIQNTNSQQLVDFPNNLEQLSLHPELNPDLLQVRTVRNGNMLYEPATFYSSEMANFSSPSAAAPRDTSGYQDLAAAEPGRLMVQPQYASFLHSSDPSSSSIHSSAREQGQLRNSGNWRNPSSHQGCDWMVNYASSSVANESNVPNSIFVPELNNASAYQQFVKPSYNDLSDVQCSLSNPPAQIESGESSPPLYQNTLQDVVKSASIGGVPRSDLSSSQMQQTGHGIWIGNSNELEFLPSYANQSNQIRLGNDHLWNSPSGFAARKNDEDSNPQGLSLSLSSNAQSKISLSHQFGDGCGPDVLQSRCCGISKDLSNANPVKSTATPSIISKDSGKSLHDIVGINSSTSSYRNVGPLGPFTGYATILKSSKFLKPAQELLDEFCSLRGSSKLDKAACNVSERITAEVGACTSGEAVNAAEGGIVAKGCSNSAGTSSSMLYGSNENSGDGGGAGSSSFCVSSSRPEYHQKKAKLLCMQEEVARRYKQYHQQMQMVVSSFESVAGLSSATPYISMAFKSVSKHFKCLKIAISDQLRHIRESLGEDLSATTAGTSSRLDPNMARLSYMDRSFQKNKSGGGNVAYLESQQPVWRPQRGLPERSVAILRAWLFEHFLHPYPTDTDKHMLATQTGLSRNQVSNWFINARVRVWKPMVEEIHMLETKGLTAGNQNSNKNEGNCSKEGTSQPRADQTPNKYGLESLPDKQMECLEMGYFNGDDGEGLSNGDQWNQEKRSKVECEITSNMDGTLMGFVPYRRGTLDVGEMGSVSLTLGLRHGVDGGQAQAQQPQEDQLRRHFGGHRVHDFVG